MIHLPIYNIYSELFYLFQMEIDHFSKLRGNAIGFGFFIKIYLLWGKILGDSSK